MKNDELPTVYVFGHFINNGDSNGTSNSFRKTFFKFTAQTMTSGVVLFGSHPSLALRTDYLPVVLWLVY